MCRPGCKSDTGKKRTGKGLESHAVRLAGIAIVLLLALFSLTMQTTHAQRPTGPAGESEGTCWQCHRQPNVSGTNGIAAANALCQDCHAQSETARQVDGKAVPLMIRATDFGKTRHALVACTSCHTTVARSPHKETAATGCGQCHSNLAQHIAAGDAHLNVDCAACHWNGAAVTRDGATGHVILARVDSLGRPAGLTDHTLAATVPCERCHARGNTIGAAALALPAKDITCIGCHASAPVVASPISLGALAIFMVGLALSVSVWLGGNIGGKVGLSLNEKLSIIAERSTRVIFSRRLFAVIRTAFLDGILHRRILKESISRWVAHSLILLPFMARFVLGIVTGLAAQFYPNAAWTRILIDRDAPPVAFTNDVLALLVILGAGYAGYLRATDKERRALTAGQDALALGLLAAIFAIGFLVEGVHIILAQLPWAQAWYAIGGAAVAAALGWIPLGWTVVYPVLFYVHAVLVALFVAYLPFSKFWHIIVSLFVVAIRPALDEPQPSHRPIGEQSP